MLTELFPFRRRDGAPSDDRFPRLSPFIAMLANDR